MKVPPLWGLDLFCGETQRLRAGLISFAPPALIWRGEGGSYLDQLYWHNRAGRPKGRRYENWRLTAGPTIGRETKEHSEESPCHKSQDIRKGRLENVEAPFFLEEFG